MFTQPLSLSFSAVQWLIIIPIIKTVFSRVWLFAAPWAIAHQAPLSLEFSKQEYCRGLPFPTPGDHPDPGTEPTSAALAGEFFTTEPPGKPVLYLDSTLVNILPYLYPFLYDSTCMCVFFFLNHLNINCWYGQRTNVDWELIRIGLRPTFLTTILDHFAWHTVGLENW